MSVVSAEKKTSLTAQALRDALHYDPLTGAFYHRRSRGVRMSGTRAGNVGAVGVRYVTIGVNGRLYLAHRLAFLWMTGAWPSHNVDHLNHDGLDNRWANLRDRPQSENVARARLRIGKSGVRGVSFKANGWEASIKVNGVNHYLGRFATRDRAAAAYAAALLRFGRGALAEEPRPPAATVPPPTMLISAIAEKNPRPPVTVQEVRDLLSYDPASGALRWRVNRRGLIIPAGSVAGTIKKPEGYRYVKIRSQGFPEHRLAWVIMTGSWPGCHIDHINGVPDDNRWCNLRLADPSQSATNRGLFSNNHLGLKGVQRIGRRFLATIQMRGKSRRIGRFATAHEAAAAYAKAAADLHGEFARLA